MEGEEGLESKRRKTEEECTIVLTDEEKHIFGTLLEVVRTSGCNSVLRAAGGWVRDKLMGEVRVGDIDIAVDNMFGKDFAEKVNHYFENHGDKRHKVGVIRSNPDQSKHLETATMHVFDRWLDFVNLRSEAYSEDSRIPTKMEIGTPLEDALRRDLTVNSLFYNINENKVEDFTKKGILDINNKIIRTPLPPLTTFMDDPLRVMRAIRFASRFNFEMDKELVTACCNEKVKIALKEKISRERIGKELDLMLGSVNASHAFKHIFNVNLYDAVFATPAKCEFPPNRMQESVDFVELMTSLFHIFSTHPNRGFVLPSENKRLCILASAMVPFHEYTCLSQKKKGKIINLTDHIIGESLKFANQDCEQVNVILTSANTLQPYIRNPNRKNVGLLLREVGKLWKFSLAISLLKENYISTSPLQVSEERLKYYDEFVDWINQVGLVGVWDMKPILNGGEVQTILAKPPGAWLGPVMSKMIEWQLEFPDLGQEACKQWLLENFK